jgi:hypothetical protein
MFIPDPNVFHPGSRICIKEFRYVNPKNDFLSSKKYDLGWSSRMRILIFTHPRIQGSKRHRIPDPDPEMHQVIMLLFRRDLQAARARGEVPGQLQAQRGLSQAPRRIGSSQG